MNQKKKRGWRSSSHKCREKTRRAWHHGSQRIRVFTEGIGLQCGYWMKMRTKIQIKSSDNMAPHSSTLAWKIPWMEEPSRLQSMGSLRVGHDWATSLSCIGEGNGNPLQCSCLENPRDGGACWAAVYGVTQSRTRLKWLSSSSSFSWVHSMSNK